MNVPKFLVPLAGDVEAVDDAKAIDGITYVNNVDIVGNTGRWRC